MVLNQPQRRAMTQSWKTWEGKVIDRTYPLSQYLGGDEEHGVFLTDYGEPVPHKAAIKIVLGSPESTACQLHRWNVASSLSHPHLLRIFAMGSSELAGVPLIYLVMEYADENLSHVIPDRPLTAEEARETLKPALSALAYIHGQGFAHGHLKPANIMAVDGHLRISSDGLCRIGECSPAKPDLYSPPEIDGILPAGDVWSLGMTLLEALTQHVPAWGSDEQHESNVPETLPAPFLEVVRQCLQSDPKRRWTVADIAARLEQNAPTIQERKTDQTDAASRKLLYGLVALLGLAVLAIVIAARLLNHHAVAPPVSQARAVQPKQLGVQPNPEQNPTTSRDASRVTSPSPALHQPEPNAKTPPTSSVPGEVVYQALPEVPLKASQTIQGRVKVSVRVYVDPSGSVSGAELDSPGPSKYFAQLAIAAARRWKFTPAKAGDRSVPSEWILRFEFLRTLPKVEAVRTAP
jgi:TonB family protein